MMCPGNLIDCHLVAVSVEITSSFHRNCYFFFKNGFVEFDKHIFKLGNDEQTDIMMKLKINNN